MSWPMIDVSSNNHPNGEKIDWSRVKNAGYKGVMIKATQGVDYVNPWLYADHAGARAQGLHVGFYHFAAPHLGQADRQAKFVIQRTTNLSRDLGIALDLEEDGGLTDVELVTFAKDFLAEIAKHQIGSPLYANPAWLARLAGAPWGHKLWLADWADHPSQTCWAWQRGQAAVPGIPSLTDIGTFYG